MGGVIAKLSVVTKESDDGYTCNDTKGLLKHSKKHFSNGRDFKYYYQELGRVAMLLDKTISQYAAPFEYRISHAEHSLASPVLIG